ncbi:MAG: SHOCT domain-containing protein [Lachnobacterium sp.]|nr:SHOCT domain-containing protein [Lachnobacterium sp.]
MRKKANRVLAIIFLIFAIGVLAVGITWSGEVKTSMKDTELRLAEIQQNIDASADNSIISGSVENYNQNVKVYNSYLDMYDMGFKLIMTLSIADLVVVIILIAMDKAGEEETVTPKILPASEKQEKDKDKDNATNGIVSHTDTAVDAGAVSTAGPRANVTSNTSVISNIGADGNGQTGVYTETGANTQQPAATEAKIQKTNLGGQSTIELTKQLRAYKNQLAAGKITEQEFIQRKEELLKSI